MHERAGRRRRRPNGLRGRGCREVEGCALDMVREGAPGTTPIYTARVAEERPEVGYLEAQDRRRYPQAHTQQPMTYLSGMLVPAAGLSVRDAPTGGSVTQLGLALTYGLLDDWQITVLPLALRLSPYVEYESPAISSTLRFFASEGGRARRLREPRRPGRRARRARAAAHRAPPRALARHGRHAARPRAALAPAPRRAGAPRPRLAGGDPRVPHRRHRRPRLPAHGRRADHEVRLLRPRERG
ncbi:MAG: hypothetical protein M5U28_51895 [Sandaracinaceae bacterium]|nr:hypothetical protein [Sandaracinaceae bacterium]